MWIKLLLIFLFWVPNFRERSKRWILSRQINSWFNSIPFFRMKTLCPVIWLGSLIKSFVPNMTGYRNVILGKNGLRKIYLDINIHIKNLQETVSSYRIRLLKTQDLNQMPNIPFLQTSKKKVFWRFQEVHKWNTELRWVKM